MNISEDKLLKRIALTKIHGIGVALANRLLKVMGNETAIFDATAKELMFRCNINKGVAESILSPSVMEKATFELDFIKKNKIQTFFIQDENYPTRLKDCDDAPILMYYKGEASLNMSKVISIVGTRNSTAYGNEFCDNFVRELSEKFKDLLIVSGLAYGIDIQAHKAAVKYATPTIGVLAHGLDRIYPAAHRQTAVAMLDNGGLLTEFGCDTEPDRYNFVMRNRIVAGLSDAVLVIESNKKGGALITAQLGSSYCRDVFALPGKITDQRSEGCNSLIANHQADLLLSADYFMKQMNWEAGSSSKPKAVQQELFVNLDTEEQLVYDLLRDNGNQNIDIMARELNIETYRLLPLLLQLEMKGIVKTLPGSVYGL